MFMMTALMLEPVIGAIRPARTAMNEIETLPEAELTCPRCLHEIRPVQRGRGRPSNHTKDVGCRQAPPRIFLDVKDVDEVYCRDPDQPSENAADSESAPAQARSLGEFSAQFINACVDRDILQS